MAEPEACDPTSTKYTGPTCPSPEVDESSLASCSNDPDDIDVGAVPDDIEYPEPPTVGNVTEELLTGGGVFDIYMRAGSNQLQSQYAAGRIKGAEYAAAYIEMMKLMMEQANAFVVKQFEIETAALLLKSQFEKSFYDGINAKYAAIKTVADARLTLTQSCQLPLNGEADRILKAAQTKAQDKTVDLYDRQITGFGEKHQETIFKTLMDGWAAQGVEMLADSQEGVLLPLASGTAQNELGSPFNKTVNDVMAAAGFTVSP